MEDHCNEGPVRGLEDGAVVMEVEAEVEAGDDAVLGW